MSYSSAISALFRQHYGGPTSEVFLHQMTLVSEVEEQILIDGTAPTFNTIIPGLDLESCAVLCYGIVACSHFDHARETNECRLVI